MADTNLTQAEADTLMEMEKHRVDDERTDFPGEGQRANIPLHSRDRRELFRLDLSRGRIDLRKITMQNRARQSVVLARLDLGGAPHRNPDGAEIPVPHLHIYREGYGDKWAVSAPSDHFSDIENLQKMLDDFMRYCNITHPPHIYVPNMVQRGLLT